MKTIFQNVIILSLVVYAFGACKKKDTYKAYSFSGISAVANGGDVYFNGNASGGSDPVLDCGVIMSNTSGANIDNALQKVSIGQINTSSADEFRASFNYLSLNATYYVKGYIKDANGYTYSSELSATTHCLAVDSIYPKVTITSSTNFFIYGKNFGTVASNIVVTFGNYQGTVSQSLAPSSISNNVLNVNIPSGFSSGDKVTFSVQRIDNGCPYTYSASNIYDVTYQ